MLGNVRCSSRTKNESSVGLVGARRAARARGRAAARTRAARSRRSSRRGACRGRRRTSRHRPGSARIGDRCRRKRARPAVCSRPMDAAQALADLTEISSQVVQVAIVDEDGSIWPRRSPTPAAPSASPTGVARLSSRPTRCAQARGLPELAPARGGDARRAASSSSRRDGRADRRDHAARPDGRPRLLRPEALPALDRGRRGARRAARARKPRAPRKKADAAA